MDLSLISWVSNPPASRLTRHSKFTGVAFSVGPTTQKATYYIFLDSYVFSKEKHVERKNKMRHQNNKIADLGGRIWGQSYTSLLTLLRAWSNKNSFSVTKSQILIVGCTNFTGSDFPANSICNSSNMYRLRTLWTFMYIGTTFLHLMTSCFVWSTPELTWGDCNFLLRT